MPYEALNDDSERNDTSDTSSFKHGSIRSAAASVASKLRGTRESEPLSEPLTGYDDETDEDPYFVFRGDLIQKLELVDESLAEYMRVVHQTDTSVNSHELKSTKKQLKRHIRNAESTLRDVQLTVQLVEKDREKFSHINDQELYERRSLCETSTNRIQRAKDESQSEAIKAKLLADERARVARRTGDMGAKTDGERKNTNRIVDSKARTSLLMEHQDETLDELDAAVSRVGRMADGIGDEIGQQNKMLTEMETDLDEADEQLGLVMGNLSKFLQTKNNAELYSIMVLFLIMLLLLLLVLYT